MKILKCKSWLMVVAAAMFGCSSNNSATHPTTQIVDAMSAATWVMPSGNAKVLKVSSPSDFKCKIADGSLHFTAPQNYEVELWLSPTAHTVDDAVGLVSTQIVSEFKEFTPDQTTALTIAGSPAKRLVGTGHEADDNDPGDADVIVFKVGDHVFVACTHGESLNPVAQQAMLTLVQTAQVP